MNRRIEFRLPNLLTNDKGETLLLVFCPFLDLGVEPPSPGWHVAFGAEVIEQHYASMDELREATARQMQPVDAFIGHVSALAAIPTLEGSDFGPEQTLSFENGGSPITGKIGLVINTKSTPPLFRLEITVGQTAYSSAFASLQEVQSLLRPWSSLASRSIAGLEQALKEIGVRSP